MYNPHLRGVCTITHFDHNNVIMETYQANEQ